MKILSLDISSSTIGWALFSQENSQLLNYGHISPPSKKDAEKKNMGFSYRLNFIFEEISLLLKRENPDIVIVEDYAKKFSAGKSSANTIIVLATTNETVSLVCFQELKKEVVRIPVKTIRNIISEKYSIDINNKDDVLNLNLKLFSNFNVVKNKNNNIKKEIYDESDAIITGLAYIKSME